jgi:hypothetical protein
MPEEDELEKAEREADEAIARAKKAAAEEERSRGGFRDDYGGDPREHAPEEVDHESLSRNPDLPRLVQ